MLRKNIIAIILYWMLQRYLSTLAGTVKILYKTPSAKICNRSILIKICSTVPFVCFLLFVFFWGGGVRWLPTFC